MIKRDDEEANNGRDVSGGFKVNRVGGGEHEEDYRDQCKDERKDKD